MVSSVSSAAPRGSAIPASRAGIATLSARLSSSSRPNRWGTTATVCQDADAGRLRAGHLHRALVGGLPAEQAVEQRRLARARPAEQRHDLAGVHLDADPAQRVHLLAAAAVALVHLGRPAARRS